MPIQHTPASLADDAIALERALGTLDDLARATLTPYLLGIAVPVPGDSALDLIITDRPVNERVAVQLRALQGGYQRPFLRH